MYGLGFSTTLLQPAISPPTAILLPSMNTIVSRCLNAGMLLGRTLTIEGDVNERNEVGKTSVTEEIGRKDEKADGDGGKEGQEGR